MMIMIIVIASRRAANNDGDYNNYDKDGGEVLERVDTEGTLDEAPVAAAVEDPAALAVDPIIITMITMITIVTIITIITIITTITMITMITIITNNSNNDNITISIIIISSSTACAGTWCPPPGPGGPLI